MANRHAQKHSQAALERRLRGVKDPRSTAGILGRGKAMYLGGASTGQRGSELNLGRPKGARDNVPRKSAIRRRLAQRRG